MTISNTTKPSSSMTNSTRINIGETWDSNVSSWDTETRSWDEMASIITNSTRVSSSMTNIPK